MILGGDRRYIYQRWQLNVTDPDISRRNENRDDIRHGIMIKRPVPSPTGRTCFDQFVTTEKPTQKLNHPFL